VLTVVPPTVAPIANARDAAFETLLASHQLVAPLLDADRDAAAGKAVYDAAYYERFFTRARPLLEQQLAGSIAMTAAMIAGAWEAAGKPVPRTAVPAAVPRVR
jgi:hypothetical protein